MEKEDDFKSDKTNQGNINSLKRNLEDLEKKNETSNSSFSSDSADSQEENDPEEENLPRNTQFFAQEVKMNTEKKIPDPIKLDCIKVILDIILKRKIVLKQASSHKLMIRDVEVYFPFKPYDVQIDYMASGSLLIKDFENNIIIQ